MKFGGTSVADEKAMARVAAIVRSRAENLDPESRLIIVTSACAGITDRLVSIADATVRGDYDRAESEADGIASFHRDLASRSRLDDDLGHVLDDEIDAFLGVVRGARLLDESTPRLRDRILASGELLSSLLLCGALRVAGLTAARGRSDEIVRTDASFGRATPDAAATAKAAESRLMPLLDRATAVVLQGFIGGTGADRITTLGRGGSDYSASIIGAAIGAERIEIWTDVDGVLSADPRSIPEARPIGRMSAGEAAVLSRYGAKVIHPETIRPAISASIPVVILNTMHPELGGTTIVDDAEEVGPGFHAVTGRRSVCLLRFRFETTEGAAEWLREIDERIDSETLNLSIAGRSGLIVLDDDDHAIRLRRRIESRDGRASTEPIGLICVTGSRLPEQGRDVARLLSAIESESILLCDLGTSENALFIGVPTDRFDAVLATLHSAIPSSESA